MVIFSSMICCEHREDGELSASFHEGLLSVSGDLKSELERPLSEQDCLKCSAFYRTRNNREQARSSMFKSYMASIICVVINYNKATHDSE